MTGKPIDAHAVAPSRRMNQRAARVAAAVALASLLIAGAIGVSTTVLADGRPDRRPDRDAQLRFMWAMAGQESGWDYFSRNASSGAFGKYQIMPFNWPAWASKYLGDSRADQTPYNQEKVAFGKIRDLYGWLGSWKRVAYWWLTGSDERRERRWSSYARGYVRNILTLRDRAPRHGWRMPAWTTSRAGRGDWRRSATRQRLRLDPGGRAWPGRGIVKDGDVVRVQRATTVRRGARWMRVVTVDGRLGWLPQVTTLPAGQPRAARRWRDVDDRGPSRGHVDRRQTRPRPR